MHTTHDEVKKRFQFEKPSEKQDGRLKILSTQTQEFAETIDRICPDGREKSLALTRLGEAFMWAGKSIVSIKE